MSKTQTEINAEIRAKARAFDMNVDEDALLAIDAMSGTDGLPTSLVVEDGANGESPLATSLSLLQFRETDAWVEILNGVENIKNHLKKKSEDMSLGRDQRLSCLDQLQGIATVMAFIGSQFQAAQERMAHLSSDNKLLIGPEGRREITEAASKPVSDSARTQVTDNTAAAVAFLSKKGN